MSRTNTFSSYGSVTKMFHWLTALLIFSAFPLGYVANQLAHVINSPEFDGSLAMIERATLLFSLHKTIGVAIFFVALGRIIWAMTQTKPGLLHPDNKPEALVAETVHWLLYSSLVLVPLTGWLHHAATVGYAPIWWPFGQGLPFVPKSEPVASLFSQLHGLFVWTLFVTLGLHIAGALKHQIIDRDATLARMLPGRRTMAKPPKQRHSARPAVAAIVVWVAVIGGAAIVSPRPEQRNGQTAKLDQVTSGWEVVDGTVAISIVQMGSHVTGGFSDWTAAINFDDTAPIGPAGDVKVTIAIDSFKLGTVTAQAMGPDYFDSATYPTALFKAGIEKREDGGYQAAGTLTIRDKTLPIVLPFSLELNANHAKMAGLVTLNRLDFDIGQGLPDESSLGFSVEIQIDLTADRAN